MRIPWRRSREQTRSLPSPRPEAPVDLDHLGDWLVRLVPTAPGLARTIDALDELFDETPPGRLFSLDAHARGWSKWDDSSWRALNPEDVGAFVKDRPASIAVPAALSMHRNGFVREAAVRQLEERHDGLELRWLLLRCADWVDNVRWRAESAVERRFAGQPVPSPYREELMRLLPVVVSERLSRSRVHTSLLDFVRHPDQRASLSTASVSSDKEIRRAAARLLADLEPTLELLEAQLDVGDIVASSEVASTLLEDPETCLGAADLMLRSGHPRLRETGLWHRVHHHPPALDQIGNSLLDRSYGVRWMAQRSATDQGIALPEWYRSRQDEHLLGALLGLGDVGSADDVALATVHVGSDRSRVRAAAIRIIARQAPREHLDLLLDVVAQDSRRVAREAIAGIRSLGIDEALTDRIWELATSDTPSGPGRRRLFRQLLAHASRWTSLLVSLRSVVHEGAEVQQLGAEMMERALDGWNSSATRPRDGQLDEIKRLVGTDTETDPHRRAMLDEIRRIATTWK